MERVLWQKRLAELWVAQSSITILVKASHEQSDLIIVDFQAEVFEPMDQVLDACWPSTWFIKDPEGINQVEICFQAELYFDLLNILLKLKLVLEDVVYVSIGRALASCIFTFA